jgi:DNA replication ATP-dependent helicase Dna2
MHNGLIMKTLQQRLGVDRASKIQVDTVERYQGQEREVILFSFGSGHGAAAESDAAFLADAKRLNVAVTRARSRVYCFAALDLLGVAARSRHCPGLKHLESFFASFPK